MKIDLIEMGNPGKGMMGCGFMQVSEFRSRILGVKLLVFDVSHARDVPRAG